MFRKLNRVWSHNSYSYIPKFRETFPELNKLDYEELCHRWKSLGIDFYTEEKTEVKVWIRFTLPFALITFVLMYIGLPFAFLFTGKWSYGNGDKSKILNWFRALHLI